MDIFISDSTYNIYGYLFFPYSVPVDTSIINQNVNTAKLLNRFLESILNNGKWTY